MKFVKAVLPGSPDDGMKKQDLLDKRAGADEQISARTLDRALAWLVKQGDVGEKQLMDQRGKPKVYWLAYKPPSGDDDLFSPNPYRESGFGENKPDEDSIYSRQTPSAYGENKNITPSGAVDDGVPLEPGGTDVRAHEGARRRLTEEEAQRVQRLIAQGTKPEIARREVLGEGASVNGPMCRF